MKIPSSQSFESKLKAQGVKNQRQTVQTRAWWHPKLRSRSLDIHSFLIKEKNLSCHSPRSGSPVQVTQRILGRTKSQAGQGQKQMLNCPSQRMQRLRLEALAVRRIEAMKNFPNVRNPRQMLRDLDVWSCVKMRKSPQQHHPKSTKGVQVGRNFAGKPTGQGLQSPRQTRKVPIEV